MNSFLTTKEVMQRFGWSRTTLWRRVKSGEFPAPIDTNPTAHKRWSLSTIRDYEKKIYG